MALAAVLFLTGVGAAGARERTWVGGASGSPTDWNAAFNWSPVGTPEAADNVTIPGGLPAYPVLDTAAPSPVKNLTVSPGASLTLNRGGSLILSHNPAVGGSLNLAGGSLLAEQGSLDLGGALNFSSGLLAVRSFSGNGTTAMSGGSLQVGGDFSPIPANFSATGGTVEWTANAGESTLPAGTYHFFNLMIDSGANLGFDNKTVTLYVAGNWTNNGLFTPAHGNPTVIFDGVGPQIIGGSAATTFDNLEINNAAGVTLASPASVTGTLALTTGILATGANQISVAAGGTSSGGSSGSYVFGALQKSFAAGKGQSFTFPIGDATRYTPVSLDSLDVTTAGSLSARTEPCEHPCLCRSGIDPARDVNRCWTLAPGGIAVSACTATFNFAAGDVDAGANPAKFVVERFGGAWSATDPGTPGTTSITTPGLSSFGDFAVGERTLVNVASCCREASHHMTISVFGLPGWPYSIQASTNLTDWTKIGSVSADTNGVCQYDDASAAGFAQRYYRAVYP